MIAPQRTTGIEDCTLLIGRAVGDLRYLVFKLSTEVFEKQIKACCADESGEAGQ